MSDCDPSDMSVYTTEHSVPEASACPNSSLSAKFLARVRLPLHSFRPFRKNPAEFCAKSGPEIQWVHSYVTGDKIYCIYIAPNEEMVREHASQGGFPANRVSEITTVIDPTTAEA